MGRMIFTIKCQDSTGTQDYAVVDSKLRLVRTVRKMADHFKLKDWQSTRIVIEPSGYKDQNEDKERQLREYLYDQGRADANKGIKPKLDHVDYCQGYQTRLQFLEWKLSQGEAVKTGNRIKVRDNA